MAKGSESSRSFLRLIFWEGIALAGFLNIRLHPMASPLWELNFFYNALFFIVAYPILYVYRWKMAGGFLAVVMWPVSFILSWALGLSAYLWAAYILFFTGSQYFSPMVQHWPVLGFLFIFIYFPLIQPLLGISKKYCPLDKLIWIFIYSLLGGFLGFLFGRFVDAKFGVSLAAHHWEFLAWLALILLGGAVGAQVAQRTREK